MIMLGLMDHYQVLEPEIPLRLVSRLEQEPNSC